MSNEARDPVFERLLQYLLETRGFDFSGYKRASLQRRVVKRMGQVGINDFGEYQRYLQAQPDEFPALFNTILINVTSYFRDAEAWEYLNREILRRIIGGKDRQEPIRVWCAGAASGQEAFTIAILLSEALGSAEYRERAKIYATDVDEEALAQARLGQAEASQLEEVPAEFREKYFEFARSHYSFRSDLRRSIIFGRHDLLRDAPISRIDLLICRNTLMYFDAETQAKILARLHYAVNDKGYLFLGKAEMLLSRDSLFVPVDPKERVFTKVPKVTLRERLLVLTQAGNSDPATQANRSSRASEVAADAVPIGQLVVDTGGFIVSINGRARSVFGLVGADIGRPLQDLEISYRPLELRSRIDEAYHDRRPVITRNVERRGIDGQMQWYDVELTPLFDDDGATLGVSIAFVEVTAYNRLTQELQRSKDELQTASEELQATNEELETTNEELQSTVEELETTNEELQSSNQELETMNEELESTNSELEAINTELEQRGVQLDRVNAFLEHIMANLEFGVAVLDKELRIQLWNREAEDLWGLRADEAIGRPLLGLEIGLPMAALKKPIQESLTAANGHHELRVSATNRLGKAFTCRVQASRMTGVDGGGVIVLMEVAEPDGQH